MKIGILTLPLHTNYGGILQAYALMQVLTNQGHDVWLINKKRIYILPVYKRYFVYLKRGLMKFVFGKKSVEIFIEQRWQKESGMLSKNVMVFIQNEIKQIIEVNSYKNIPKDNFDMIVVGSDQVWRPKYFAPIEDAYLLFTKKWKIKCIAYAASFGSEQWEYNKTQTRKCRKLVKKFDAVSVREDSGVNLCKDNLGINAVHVLDPTILLDVCHYISLIRKENIKRSLGNLFVYVLNKNNDTNEIEKQIVDTFGYVPFYSSTDCDGALLNEREATKVEVWLRSFYDAEFVLTDSFHACVFSIIFHKHFVVYCNEERGGTRLISMLRIVGLEDRMINSVQDFWQIKANIPKIDWNEVDNRINKMKVQSVNYLQSALSQ